MDQNTKKEKQVQQYTFRDQNGGKFVLLGAFLLDLAFEEVFEKEGGIERCLGLNFKIERGSDSKLSRNRSMGNYEISVWEE